MINGKLYMFCLFGSYLLKKSSHLFMSDSYVRLIGETFNNVYYSVSNTIMFVLGVFTFIWMLGFNYEKQIEERKKILSYVFCFFLCLRY